MHHKELCMMVVSYFIYTLLSAVFSFLIHEMKHTFNLDIITWLADSPWQVKKNLYFLLA